MTVDEGNAKIFASVDHFSSWSITAPQATEVATILEFKSNSVNDKLEALREAKEIGQSLDAEVHIIGSGQDPLFQVLKKHEASLAELFIVSSVVVEEEIQSKLIVTARHARGVRCPRSWRWVPELVETKEWGPVSPRCGKVLSNTRNAQADPSSSNSA